MDQISRSWDTAVNSMVQAAPYVVHALLLLLLAWFVALIVRFIVQKGFKVLKVPAALQKVNVVKSEADGANMLDNVGKALYYLVFLLFLPSILAALNMHVVSQPLSDMMAQIVNFLPNLLAAVITLIIGFILAKLVRQLLVKFLEGVGIDNLSQRIGVLEEKSELTLSRLLGNIVYVLILIPIVIAALDMLNISAISQPAVNMLQDILTMVPYVIVAVILLVIGVYIARFAGELLTSVLEKAGIDSVLSRLGFQAAQDKMADFRLSKIIGQIVKILILLFFVVEALRVVQLQVLNEIGQGIITYIPLVLSAIFIIGVGLLLASFVERLVKRVSSGSLIVAKVLKYGIIVFAIFMALDQLGFATTLVHSAFIIIVGGLVIAFAIAFGFGGRDFAARSLENMEKNYEQVEQNLIEAEAQKEQQEEQQEGKE